MVLFYYFFFKKRNYIRQLSNPLRTHKLIRSNPVKAGRPVWQTIICTLKAKGHCFKSGTERDQTKRSDWTNRFPTGMSLQLLHVETGNVLTDMRNTMWRKRDTKRRTTVLLNTEWYNISFCSNHSKSLCVRVCVCFGCEASGLTTASVRLGDPKVPLRVFFSISAALTVCMKAFNLLLYWTLSTRPQKSYLWKITETTGLLYINKNVKRNKLFGWWWTKKKNLTDGATVHFLLCRQAPLLWNKQLTVRGTWEL